MTALCFRGGGGGERERGREGGRKREGEFFGLVRCRGRERSVEREKTLVIDSLRPLRSVSFLPSLSPSLHQTPFFSCSHRSASSCLSTSPMICPTDCSAFRSSSVLSWSLRNPRTASRRARARASASAWRTRTRRYAAMAAARSSGGAGAAAAGGAAAATSAIWRGETLKDRGRRKDDGEKKTNAIERSIRAAREEETALSLSLSLLLPLLSSLSPSALVACKERTAEREGSRGAKSAECAEEPREGEKSEQAR